MDEGRRNAFAVRFGAFELDSETGELRRSGALIRLQSQQFQLLSFLTGKPGRIVNRDEIRCALWGDETHVDFDQSINVSIRKIREALGDDPQAPRYIETLPRKGYRFIAPVTVVSAEEPSRAEQKAEPATAEQSKRWWWMSVAAAVVLAGVLTTAISGNSAKHIRAVAVLPFESLSPDPDQDYFAAGMTD